MKLSYAELDKASSQLAGRLLVLGARPETYIAYCFEKRGLAVVAMLAIMKSVSLRYRGPNVR